MAFHRWTTNRPVGICAVFTSQRVAAGRSEGHHHGHGTCRNNSNNNNLAYFGLLPAPLTKALNALSSRLRVRLLRLSSASGPKFSSATALSCKSEAASAAEAPFKVLFFVSTGKGGYIEKGANDFHRNVVWPSEGPYGRGRRK